MFMVLRTGYMVSTIILCAISYIVLAASLCFSHLQPIETMIIISNFQLQDTQKIRISFSNVWSFESDGFYLHLESYNAFSSYYILPFCCNYYYIIDLFMVLQARSFSMGCYCKAFSKL